MDGEEEQAQRAESPHGTHSYTEGLNWRTCVVMCFLVLTHVF